MRLRSVPQIQYPEGEFSHSDVRRFMNRRAREQALLRGEAFRDDLTNQHIWKQWERDLKNGTIIRTGTRPKAGKGRAEFVHIVNHRFLQLMVIPASHRPENWKMVRVPHVHCLPDSTPPPAPMEVMKVPPAPVEVMKVPPAPMEVMKEIAPAAPQAPAVIELLPEIREALADGRLTEAEVQEALLTAPETVAVS